MVHTMKDTGSMENSMAKAPVLIVLETNILAIFSMIKGMDLVLRSISMDKGMKETSEMI